MKKIFSAIFVLISAILLGGCTNMTIPNKLGEPEGLWLYKGPERMRTDGSEVELLFDEIELAGATYTFKDYALFGYFYCTDTKTAFFQLCIDNENYLYIYDYADKKEVGHREYTDRYAHLIDSDAYVCLENEYDLSKSLFTRDGVFVADFEPGYNFARDALWKYVWHEDGEELVWWKGGESHSVMLPPREGGFYCLYDGEYFYDCTETGTRTVHAETEEVEALSGGVPAPDLSRTDEMRELICGEYTFRVESKTYGFLFGGEYHYLYRDYHGKTEVVQYASLHDWNVKYHCKFFDDICAF